MGKEKKNCVYIKRKTRINANIVIPTIQTSNEICFLKKDPHYSGATRESPKPCPSSLTRQFQNEFSQKVVRLEAVVVPDGELQHLVLQLPSGYVLKHQGLVPLRVQRAGDVLCSPLVFWSANNRTSHRKTAYNMRRSRSRSLARSRELARYTRTQRDACKHCFTCSVQS